jgi:creatinine amidohydrolase
MGTDTGCHFIERMHWDEVARRIGDGALAILPIGSAAKQHGLHLPLNTDRIQAEWLAGKVAEPIHALVWPTLTYGYYPAFAGYAGSCSLSITTFEALVREIAGQILDGGCRKLLVLNTGISSLAPVDRALARLPYDRVRHLWIHEGPRYPRIARQLAEQGHGSHADELETSLMLAIAPDLVDMARAEASSSVARETPGALAPVDPTSPTYSRSGTYGDPTRATSAKGEALLAAMLDDLHEQAAAFATEDVSAPRMAGILSVMG